MLGIERLSIRRQFLFLFVIITAFSFLLAIEIRTNRNLRREEKELDKLLQSLPAPKSHPAPKHSVPNSPPPCAKRVFTSI
jgi:hypothetical protein